MNRSLPHICSPRSRRVSIAADGARRRCPRFRSGPPAGRACPAAVSVVVSFAAVRARPRTVAGCSCRSCRGRRTAPYDGQQSWKACWGQPLKGSNPLSSAPLTRAIGGRSRVPSACASLSSSQSTTSHPCASPVHSRHRRSVVLDVSHRRERGRDRRVRASFPSGIPS